MREIMGHTPGRIYLAVLVLSIVAMAVAVAKGALNTPAGGVPVLIFGWITMPLALGIAFVLVWLVAYLVYFFRYWPFR
jgi:hypothetical protein